jgi:hypothetical protein
MRCLTRDEQAVQDAAVGREDLHRIAGLEARETQPLDAIQRAEEHDHEERRRHEDAEHDVETDLHFPLPERDMIQIAHLLPAF